MSTSPQVSPQQTLELVQKLLSPEIKNNPYNFVMFAFPWGQKNTPLENKAGPNKWQTEELLKIAAHIQKNIERVSQGKTALVYKCAISSGRGVGK